MLWTGEPKPLKPQDYSRAVSGIIDAAQNTGLAVAVYTSGSVSVPGISDLDIWIVFKDRARISWRDFKKALRPEHTKPLLHTPFALHQRVFPGLSYLTDTRGLRLVWGQELRMLPVENPGVVHGAVAGRFAAARLVSLSKVLFFNRARVWSLLCQLNGIKHNYSLLGLPEPEQLIRIQDLRQNWFEMGHERFERLLSLIHDARNLLLDFLAKTGPHGVSANKGPGFRAGHWFFGDFARFSHRPGPLSWLPKTGLFGEVAFSSTRFQVPTHPAMVRALRYTGASDLEMAGRFAAKHDPGAFVGFSPPYPLLKPMGFRRFVP